MADRINDDDVQDDVHGYHDAENEELRDQAETLIRLLYALPDRRSSLLLLPHSCRRPDPPHPTCEGHERDE